MFYFEVVYVYVDVSVHRLYLNHSDIFFNCKFTIYSIVYNKSNK
jgi:hypothetical protein